MNYEKVKKQQERCRKEWFKNHKAEVITDETNQRGNTMVVDFSNPESWNYGCRLIIHRRWLIVVGDIGEAVYEWGQDVGFPFLAKIDFGYFYEKCQSSETGRRYTQWDSREAYDAIHKLLAELDEQNHPGEKDDWRSHLRELTKNSAEDEFQLAVHRAYSEGADPMDISGIIESGKQPNCRAIGHYVALQMVIEQLTPKPTNAESPGH